MIKHSYEEKKRIADGLIKKLNAHASFQRTQYELYDGVYTVPPLDDSPASAVDSKFDTKLDLSRIEVDYIANKIVFDTLLNDKWDISKALERANCDEVFRSAIKNSMIGACSFVSVTRGNVSLGEPSVVISPYTAKKATGEYNSRTGRLDYGLAEENYKENEFGYKTVTSYLIFLQDSVWRYWVEDDTFEFVEESPFGCQLVLFAYDGDTASRPFGRPRTAPSQKSLYNNAVRAFSSLQMASRFYNHPIRYFFVEDNPLEDLQSASRHSYWVDPSGNRVDNIDEISFEERELLEEVIEEPEIAEAWSATMGNILEYRGSSRPTIGQLDPSSPEPILKTLYSTLESYAAAAYMDPQEFGVSPSSGGISAEAKAQYHEKTNDLVRATKRSYGESIKRVAQLVAVTKGEKITDDLFDIQVAWVDTPNTAGMTFGALGDALGKIMELQPDLKNTDKVAEMIGIPKRGRIKTDKGIKEIAQSDIETDIESDENFTS